MMNVAVLGIVLALPILRDGQRGPSLWHQSAAQARVAGLDAELAPRIPFQKALLVPRDREVNGHRLRTVARFELEALVLARRDYSFGREAGFSGTDLALGWGRMSNPVHVEEVKVTQARRFYFWSQKPGSKLTPDEVTRSSSNMHLILTESAHHDAMKAIGKGDVVVIEGWLVDVTGPKGREWRSSRRRDDTGAGACEIILVDRIRRRAPVQDVTTTG
ncbi:hypothetical protein GCM10011326_12960 [Salipiger profundus]|nr:hypothetical protein GCM10011326_12960 [Salipiger profundus]